MVGPSPGSISSTPSDKESDYGYGTNDVTFRVEIGDLVPNLYPISQVSWIPGSCRPMNLFDVESAEDDLPTAITAAMTAPPATPKNPEMSSNKFHRN